MLVKHVIFTIANKKFWLIYKSWIFKLANLPLLHISADLRAELLEKYLCQLSSTSKASSSSVLPNTA